MNKTRISCVTVIIATGIGIIGCKKEEQNPGKLFSRNLILQHVKATELEVTLNRMAAATGTSRRDVRKDVDGNDMFLYSSNNLVIFVHRKFDEPCDELGCAWKVDVSPADTGLSATAQKKIVDAAFTSMVGIGAIQARSR